MLTEKISEQEIRSILDEILKRREFHTEKKQNPIVKLMNSIWEAIQEWVRQLLQYRQPDREIRINPDINNPVLQTVLKILLILIAAVLVFLLARLIIKKVYLTGKIRRLKTPEAYDYLTKPDEAIETYYGYMSAGEYPMALRFLFIALLLELDKRKIIKIEKWKTNRIYIREIGLRDKTLVLPMQEFSTLFNACCYGNMDIDEASVDKWFKFYINQKEKQV
ncbi:MAG: DUF4129 domain-containing protein [Clostridiaceae bacterium]|nr:DUF4129 domain-containing protein [Clostridiaceae bacterium]